MTRPQLLTRGERLSLERDISPLAPWRPSIAHLAQRGVCHHARTQQNALLSFGCVAVALLTPGKVLPAVTPCQEWNLAQDFRISPDQENPNRDQCSNLAM
jgi:hypothetical protein